MEVRTTYVNKIDSNGKYYPAEYTFVNNYSAEYNLLSLYLELSKRTSALMDEDERSKYKNMICKTDNIAFFMLNGNVYTIVLR